MSEWCSRGPRVRRRRIFWERWPTGIAVIVMLVAVAGVGLYPSLESVPGYAPWQDKASTAIRQIELGGPLDAFENWLYSKHPPSDAPPDVRGRLTAASPALTCQTVRIKVAEP